MTGEKYCNVILSHSFLIQSLTLLVIGNVSTLEVVFLCLLYFNGCHYFKKSIPPYSNDTKKEVGSVYSLPIKLIKMFCKDGKT